MAAELTELVGYQKHDSAGRNSGNSRNGKSAKTLKGMQIIEKHQTRFSRQHAISFLISQLWWCKRRRDDCEFNSDRGSERDTLTGFWRLQRYTTRRQIRVPRSSQNLGFKMDGMGFLYSCRKRQTDQIGNDCHWWLASFTLVIAK